MTEDEIAKNLLIGKKCKCYEEHGAVAFNYITIDKYMGFVDRDENKLVPKFCPWCGMPKGE